MVMHTPVTFWLSLPIVELDAWVTAGFAASQVAAGSE